LAEKPVEGGAEATGAARTWAASLHADFGRAPSASLKSNFEHPVSVVLDDPFALEFRPSKLDAPPTGDHPDERSESLAAHALQR
jgi:hypothetical protein